MTSMIEKVAKAIGRAELGDEWNSGLHWNMNAPNRHRLCSVARGAILAMREPTEGMLDAMDKGTPDGMTRYDNERERRQLAYTMPYQAAIDAALAEDGE